MDAQGVQQVAVLDEFVHGVRQHLIENLGARMIVVGRGSAGVSACIAGLSRIGRA